MKIYLNLPKNNANIRNLTTISLLFTETCRIKMEKKVVASTRVDKYPPRTGFNVR